MFQLQNIKEIQYLGPVIVHSMSDEGVTTITHSSRITERKGDEEWNRNPNTDFTKAVVELGLYKKHYFIFEKV